MSPRRKGQPSLIDSKQLVEKIISVKGSIVENDKIVSATNQIWTTLAVALSLSPSTIHSYVVNNRYNLKDLLLDKIFYDSENSVNNKENNISLNSTASSVAQNEFSFAFKKAEFEKMMTETTSYTIIKGKRKRRVRTILKQNIWADEFALAIWNAVKSKHAFKFKNHHLTRDGSSGQIKGMF